MSDFSLFLKLGFEHISDLQGYDHILFIVALCAIYTLKDWRGILWMVTAFTIGHSITLVLATFEVIMVSQTLVEKAIPLTILLTCLFNIFLTKGEKNVKQSATIKYLIACGFGLIHGLGFSGYLRSLLAMQDSIVLELLAFNIGLELGQILIVMITLVLAFIFVDKLKAPKREWNLVLSGAAGGVSLLMVLGLI
ncbi:HupE/UreJ family protein [Penaeicola halotolerans]|uniref:HupE/UreJ family protein n=1 Tax=Penaeicola halotolerans TaxID=2793196 RepID=UPI001CF913BD|nr:HupE/UreJ family protein [Penaeicola halotolerans]